MEYAKMTPAQLEEEYASVSRRFAELKECVPSAQRIGEIRAYRDGARILLR